MEEKIEIMRKELDRLTKAVTQKRTELGGLARARVEDFENAIPELERKAAVFKDELAVLNNQIANRQQEIQSLRNTLQADYDSMKQDLQKEYEFKFEKLKELEHGLNEKLSAVCERESAAIELERKLAEWQENIRTKSSYLDSRESDISIKREVLNNDVEGHRVISDERTAQLDEREKAIDEKHAELDLAIVSANKEKEKAVAVQERLDEANKALEQAKAIAELAESKMQSVNEKFVALQAEKKSLSDRAKALDLKESNLAKRENNLKLAEAHIAAGGQ